MVGTQFEKWLKLAPHMLSSHRSRSVKANVQVSEQCAAKDKNDVDLKNEFGTFRQNKIEGSTPILKLAMVKRL